MDGVAMILDEDLRIAQVGRPNWKAFFESNPPPSIAPQTRPGEKFIGHPVTQFFAGEEVRLIFGDLFRSVLDGARPVVRTDYRCDAPETRREMRLSVTPIMTRGKIKSLLYHSVPLFVGKRQAIPLFGAPVAEEGGDDTMTLCAICALVAWPIGAPEGAREWIEPTLYYRRGGETVTLITHDICEACRAELHEPDSLDG
jgi:hypothetical protein